LRGAERGHLLEFAATAAFCGDQLSKIVMTQAAATSSHAPLVANAENRYEVTRADLPLSCPMPGMALWNSHPKVYLAVEATGSAKCPYCGALYTLKS
jgi:uncharacterized Zn-finger protein